MNVSLHQRRRVSRRAFVRLAVGAGALLLAGGVARQGWRLRVGDGELLESYLEAPGPGILPEVTGPTVAVVRGSDPASMVRQAVDLAGGLTAIKPGGEVLIKPNLTIASASGLGNVTDSRVLRAIIELCQRAGATKIVVADGSGGGDSEQIMRQAGYEEVLKATGATFVDLNRDQVVTRKLRDPAGLSEYHLAKTAAEAPFFISAAVLKVHHAAIVTLCCKNLIGIAARSVYGKPRQQLHDVGVQKVTADLARLRKPDFAIIDGIVGLEGDSPLNGTPVRMDLIIAGANVVSVDAIGAAIMGFDPKQLEQLQILSQKGLGEIDPQKITIRGRAIAEVQRKFKR